MTDRERALKVINKVIARCSVTHEELVASDQGHDVYITLFTNDRRAILIDAMRELGFGDITKELTDG